MKVKILFFTAILFAVSINSQTTLSAGDIAIIQYNADLNGSGQEVIKFLALAPMESGTTINFTDNGWLNSGGFRTGEGTHVWTASSNINCGEIVTMNITPGSFNLASNGDQIIAYQGTSGSPTMLFAINNQGSAVWQANANNSNNSALPTGLTNGTNAVALNEVDNVIYTGSLTGTKATILANICNSANWGPGSNTVVQNFSNTFTSETTWTTSWSNPNPENYFKAIIDGDYDTATDGNFTACELQINGTYTLTINDGGVVTVENEIVNNGAIVVEDNGSFVQTIPDAVNTGTNYTVQRQSTSQLEEGNYTYWSSPLTSSTLAEVTAAQRYYSFTASTQTWVAQTSASTMTPGVGYINTGNSAITYPNTYTASFNGSAFNNGAISVTLGFSSDGDADNDWNLLGNPYPSAISADTFIADNTSIGGTLYFWTHNTADSAGDNTQDDYVLWNGSGGTGSCSGCAAPDGNIASGQGFFAQALSTGTATFTNAMRVSGSNTLFYKGRPTNEKDRIWLNLSSKNGFSQTLLAFLEDATDGVDRVYDGLRLNGGGKVSFYSILEAKKYGIQGMASLDTKEIIPLGFEAAETGSFKIEIDHLEGVIKKSKVILIDKELQVEHNLKKEPYQFTVNQTGTFNDRFEIRFKTKEKDLNRLKRKTLKVHLKRNHLLVFSKETIQNIAVYSISGELLFSKEDIDNKKFRLKIKNIGNRKVLILKIQFADGEIIRRKVFNQ
ncbi:MAG: hypothetical protein HWD85_00175 [Flavobacteriaceae bacterium]|nr:hypothetical protein [Flavobacteriaceae bacterium]